MLKALVLLCALGCAAERHRHMFFRSLGHGSGSRRLFGGTATRSGSYPAACELLDIRKENSCSCSVIAPRWALTAGHCAKPSVDYVRYNGREPLDSVLEHVASLFVHPGFMATVKDLGEGPDVATLQHDVGLVRTRGDMMLSYQHYFPQPYVPRVRTDRDFLRSVMAFNVDDLRNQEIQVLGFGMSDSGPAGERLREAQLRVAACGRTGWVHCACAIGATSGVCSGDSGGPVLFNSTQIGVMSMGPIECQSSAPGREGLDVVSVFTELRPYVELINDTIHETDSVLHMREVARAAAPGVGVGVGVGKPRSSGHGIVCAVSLLLCRSF